MIMFPAWVEDPCDFQSDSDHAARRLRYMVLYAAIRSTQSGSIAALADFCGIERTQVHAAIREGRFSAKMAAEIERKCGRDVVRREWLIYPLEIQEMTV